MIVEISVRDNGKKVEETGNQSVNKVKLLAGWSLVALGIGMPRFFTIHTWQIPEEAYLAISSRDEMVLWIAAMKLAALNSIRAFPHYFGAFIIADSIESEHASGRWLKIFSVCITIPVVYFLIGEIHRIQYDFGIPALAAIVLLLLLGKSDYTYVRLWKKGMLIFVFLAAMQLLDLMPALKGLPTGRGEMSRDIKLIAEYLGMEAEMDRALAIFFLILFLVGLLLLLLIRDENRLQTMNELKAQNERMRMETRLRILENRTYLEMRQLVHDLKSPLTSVQALVGVVEMSCHAHQMEKETEYLKRVEGSVETMSSMISEILYEERGFCISTDRILNFLLAQISVAEYSGLVQADNQAPGRYVFVNRIRFCRALINLIENAFYAVDRKSGRIHLTVEASENENGSWICFTVEDNGLGMNEDTMARMWEQGFSARSSHGLGLSFVKKVVEDAGGMIQMESRAGAGTRITLWMPEDQEDSTGKRRDTHEPDRMQDTLN